MGVAKEPNNPGVLDVWEMQEEVSSVASFIEWPQFIYASLFSFLSALVLYTHTFVQQQDLGTKSRVDINLSYMPPLMVKPISIAEEMYSRRPYVQPGINDLGKVDKQTETTTSSWGPTTPPTQPPQT